MEKRAVATVVFLLAVVAVLAYVAGRESGARDMARKAAFAAHREAVDHCRALGEEATLRIKLAFKAQMSLADFEKHFGDVEPVDRGSSPEANKPWTHVYVHERSHSTFYLRFENDVLLGFSGGYDIDAIQENLPAIEERIAEMR